MHSTPMVDIYVQTFYSPIGSGSRLGTTGNTNNRRERNGGSNNETNNNSSGNPNATNNTDNSSSGNNNPFLNLSDFHFSPLLGNSTRESERNRPNTEARLNSSGSLSNLAGSRINGSTYDNNDVISQSQNNVQNNMRIDNGTTSNLSNDFLGNKRSSNVREDSEQRVSRPRVENQNFNHIDNEENENDIIIEDFGEEEDDFHSNSQLDKND